MLDSHADVLDPAARPLFDRARGQLGAYQTPMAMVDESVVRAMVFLIHQRATDKRLSDLFGAARADIQGLSPWQLANLRLMEREWLRATALSQDLVEAMSLAESRCEQAWRRLRPANDFAGFLPLFTEVVRLKREASQALGQKLGLKPYDALLDEFEPGERSASIAPLFARLRAFLPGIIEKAVERQATEQVATSQGPFPLER